MGCDETREGLEEKMLYTRLKRDEIRKQKKLLLDQLKLSTGEVYETEPIPDYVDVEYIKEKKRKHYEKIVKVELKKVEEEKRKEEKRRKKLEKELEEEMEEERYKENLLYMPLNMNLKKNDNDLEDIYYLNYVLDKKQNKHDKEKRSKSKKKTRKQKTNRYKKRNKSYEKESDNEEDKKDKNEYDFMQPLNAKIRTKEGSVKSVLDNDKKDKKENYSDDYDDSEKSEEKRKPYVTPHLLPND